MINKNELFYVLLFVLLSVLGLVAFGWMDLEFSQSIRNPGIWNTWVERLCFLPTLLAAWIQSLMLTAHWLRKQSQEDAPVLVLMLGLLSSVGLPIYVYWYEMRYFDKQSSSLGWIMIICLVAIAIWGTIRIIKKLPPREEAVRIRRATAGLVIFYGIWGLTALVSYFWGRASFRDLQTMGSYAAYTPWFRPGGQTGANMSAFTGIALCYGICISNYLTVGHNRNLRDVLVFRQPVIRPVCRMGLHAERHAVRQRCYYCGSFELCRAVCGRLPFPPVLSGGCRQAHGNPSRRAVSYSSAMPVTAV